MYKVVEKVWTDVYKVLNTDDGTTETLSISELVFALGFAKIHGCRHTKRGIEVKCQGVAKQEFKIEVWAAVEKLGLIAPNGRWKYEVSNLGNVRKFRSVNIAEVKNIRARDKLYAQPIPLRKSKADSISIACEDGAIHKIVVSLLVATAFVYNPHKSKRVAHINGDKSDCSACNLEWRIKDKRKPYTKRSSFKPVIHSKPANAPTKLPNRVFGNNLIRQYSLNGNLVSEYRDSESVERSTGFDANDILDCCRRSRKISYGYIWRFASDDEFHNASLEGYDLYDIREMFVRYIGTVRQYKKSQEFVAEYPSTSKAASATGINVAGIGGCCRRYAKTSNGFMWRFEADDELAEIPENAEAIKEWRQEHNAKG